MQHEEQTLRSCDGFAGGIGCIVVNQIESILFLTPILECGRKLQLRFTPKYWLCIALQRNADCKLWNPAWRELITSERNSPLAWRIFLSIAKPLYSFSGGIRPTFSLFQSMHSRFNFQRYFFASSGYVRPRKQLAALPASHGDA